MVSQMRVLLTLMFVAPMVAGYAVKSGAQQILPLMLGMSVLAIVAYFVFDHGDPEEE